MSFNQASQATAVHVGRTIRQGRKQAVGFVVGQEAQAAVVGRGRFDEGHWIVPMEEPATLER
jgi:hypothetical protein